MVRPYLSFPSQGGLWVLDGEYYRPLYKRQNFCLNKAQSLSAPMDELPGRYYSS